MAAYQCLNCHQIELLDEACCEKPDLFCINDMPTEILRLRKRLEDLGYTIEELERDNPFNAWMRE